MGDKTNSKIIDIHHFHMQFIQRSSVEFNSIFI